MGAALSLVIVAVLVIAGAWWLSALPGDLSVTLGDTTIQASTPIALTLLALLFFAIYVVVRLLAGLISLPRRNRRWRAENHRRQGDRSVTRTLVALAANDAGAARREAERSRRLLGDTPLTMLLAAQAARQAGREVEAEGAFQALAQSREGRLLGLRGLMRQAIDKQDWQAATTIAAQAEAAHPGAAWLRDERRTLALRTGNWREAMRLAAPNQRAALTLAAAEEEPDPNASMRLAKQAFEADPGLPAAAVTYAKRLRATGRERLAQEALRRAWSLNPQPDIAEEFVRPLPDKLARAQDMAVLVRSNPDHAESTLAVGRAALEAGLTGEARRQIEAARARGLNEKRLWTLLADVAAMDGKPEEEQDALRHVPNADPDPVWRCTNCGTQHTAWHPICHACEATGMIGWGKPINEPNPYAVRITQSQAIEGLTS